MAPKNLNPGIAGPETSLWDRSEKAMAQARACSYDLEKTYVASIKKDNFCGGAEVKVCFATLNCKAGAPSQTTACLATNGKCPASAADCIIKENRFSRSAAGADAIESSAATSASSLSGAK